MLRSFRLSKFRRKSRNHPASAEEKEEWEIGLHSAASLGDVDKVKSLLTKGAKVNMVNEHGNTALHEAAWKGYSQTVEILCNHGADVYMKNKSGFSALHLTCQNGHNQSCRLLLLAGCKPDIKNNYGDTPLHTAARYGHAGVARILISAHCHANEINKNGDTALHISSAMGRSKLTQIIVDAGCEPLIKNKQRETALEIARRKQFHEIELMLLKKSNNIHLPIRKLAKRCNKCSGTSQSSSTDKLDKHSKTNYLKRRGSGKVPKLHKHCASPYGCHMFPDSSSFPSPKLDSLPAEPLTTGEQYYIDLAGNIKKGPTGYGHSYCCKPFFRHMEKALETEKSHIMNQVDCAHKNLSTRIDSLEQRTQNYLHYLSQTMEEKLKSERKECLGRYEKHSKCKIRDTKNKNAKAVDLHSVSHHNLGISLDPNAEVNKNLPGSRHPLMWTSQRSQSEEALVMSNSNSEMQSPMHIAEIMWLAASEDNLLERIPHNRETLNYYDDFNNLRYSQHSNTEFKNQLKFQSNLNIYQSNHCSFTETHRTSLYDIRSCNNLINKKNLLLDNYVQLNKLLNDASQNKMYNGLNRTATAVKRTQPATCV